MRWQAAAVAVLGGFTGLAVLSARYLSQMRMTGPAAVGLAAANTVLAAVAFLAVTPGTTDSLAYWAAGVSGIVVAAVYFTRGPISGLAVLALDLAALTAGLRVTGGAVSVGIWASILAGPPIRMGVAAVALRVTFRRLSGGTESRLAEYGERVRMQAWAEAIRRIDNATLENARRVAGPVLEEVASGQAPTPALRMAATLADATLRDDLLAPGFLTPPLAERVRVARAAGARITLRFERQEDAALVATARRLLAAALAGLDVGRDTASEATLQLYPSAADHPALLILRVRSRWPDHAALRRHAGECALVSQFDDHELLIRLKPPGSIRPFPPSPPESAI
jgi:hypothetical protein